MFAGEAAADCEPAIDTGSLRAENECAKRVSVEMRYFTKVMLVAAASCASVALWGQSSDPSASTSGSGSWTATRDSQNDGVNPTRTVQSHVRSGNRTVDKQSIERRGDNGDFERYQDIEKETVQVNPTTVRTTTRTFGLASGARTLVQQTEEEKQSLPGGNSKVVRATSNPDANGNLQVVQREIEQTKKISADVTEKKTTVMLTDINGGLADAMRTEEREKRSGDNTVETQKTTLLPDGAGKWQVGEVRQTTVKQEGRDRSTEERVSRPNDEGKLEEISRTVSKEADSGAGEKRDTVENYSVDVPGAARDGSLHVVQKTTKLQRGDGSARQTTEQVDPSDPGAGLRLSVVSTDTTRTGPSGAQTTRTVEMRDANDSFGVVRVDTATSDNAQAVQVQIAPQKPK